MTLCIMPYQNLFSTSFCRPLGMYVAKGLFKILLGMNARTGGIVFCIHMNSHGLLLSYIIKEKRITLIVKYTCNGCSLSAYASRRTCGFLGGTHGAIQHM
jgi:hypothetical protein